MNHTKWPADPFCFIHPLDDQGVSILKLDQQASSIQHYNWSGCVLYWNPTDRYRAFYGRNFITPPRCHPNNNSSHLTLNVFNTRYEQTGQPSLATFLGIFSLIMLILIIIICVLITAASSLQSRVQALKQERDKLQSKADTEQTTIKDFINRMDHKMEYVRQYHSKNLEISMHNLILLVSKFQQEESCHPEWQTQIKQAATTIAKYRDSCNASVVVPVKTKPSTLPRPIKFSTLPKPMQQRPKSTLKVFGDIKAKGTTKYSDDEFLHTVPDPNLIKHN